MPKKTKQSFKPPRKVEEFWNLYKKGIYIERPDRRLPAWFVPLLAFLLIVAVVFWAAPLALSRLQISIGGSGDQTEEVSLIYDSSTWAVKKPVADVFDAADIKARRITQVLYNEPVEILPFNGVWGFKKVRLEDGITGYMLETDLSDHRDSLEPGLAQFKAVVAANSKRIMSHARSGTMLIEVMMGTTLLADYRGDGIIRVTMPDGQKGWVSEDGMIIMPADGAIEKTADGARFFCSSAMSFHNVTVLDNGQSRAGASVAGAARIAGLVNGLKLPRTIQEQYKSGDPVTLFYLPDNPDNADNQDQLDLSILQPSDLVFTDDAANPGMPVDMAIVMENGSFLMVRPNRTSIQLTDPAQIPDWTRRIIAVRRLY